MRKHLLFVFTFISTCLYAQEENCGFKEDCNCETTNKSIQNSYTTSAIIIDATITEIDTISIAEIIDSISVSTIKSDTINISQCAKNVLQSRQVIKVKVKILEVFKGNLENNEIYILTPLKREHCSFQNFALNDNFIIYGTVNETADIYFLWTFDQDYFNLKSEYSYWTNKCKGTTLSKQTEREKLRELKTKSN